jgi:hypothetical protein
MLGCAVVGSLLAGLYGIAHDQVTYSISSEYFTRLKFPQFRYANFGLSPRTFVAEIGFLATWWVGFFAAWFIARVTVPAFPRATAFRYSLRGFLIVFVFAFATSIVGYVLGSLHGSDYSGWEDLASELGIVDLPNFVRVAYIHNASYLGGLLGLVGAIVHLRKLRAPNYCVQATPGSALGGFQACGVGAPDAKPSQWYLRMKPKWSLLGVVMGAVMCAAGILRYNAVMRAWEHTMFHPDFESDPPLFFAGIGLVVMAISVVGGIVGWLRRRSAGREQL